MERFNQTLKACEYVKNKKWLEAAKEFYGAASKITGTKITGYHVVFVLDESGSMVCVCCVFVCVCWVCVQVCK